MSTVILIQRPMTMAAHWVNTFSLYRMVPVELVGPGVGVVDRNIFGVPGAVAGGGAVEVPTSAFMRHIRRELSW